MYFESDVITIKCKVLIVEHWQYLTLVVEDLNRETTDDFKYVTIVRPPGWDPINIQVGDVGFMQIQSVIGGKTRWINKETKELETYKYTSTYLLNFYKEKDICEQKKFNF
jgi:hypothetical protein